MTVTPPTKLHQHPLALIRRVSLIGSHDWRSETTAGGCSLVSATHAARPTDHNRDNLCDVLNMGERGEDLTNENVLPLQARLPNKALRSQEIR